MICLTVALILLKSDLNKQKKKKKRKRIGFLNDIDSLFAQNIRLDVYDSIFSVDCTISMKVYKKKMYILYRFYKVL